ncbi:MAG: hypothetical protein PF692_11745 [Kiritimatiellae bacterium]|jgi:hypothetical protein|nr:hypothetical protein [Kiritimatiellia bacterium]
MKIKRIIDRPLISNETHPELGGNINGPTVIKVPEWVEQPLGKYYMYFAHHQGKYIRMAYADNALGPYTMFDGEVLSIDGLPYEHHIASPDIVVDDENKKIIMFYHGCGVTDASQATSGQWTSYSESSDGLSFVSDDIYLCPSYLRVVKVGDRYLGSSGGPKRPVFEFTKSLRDIPEQIGNIEIKSEPFCKFENGEASMFSYRVRHLCFDLESESKLWIYYSNVKDKPEIIKRVCVDPKSWSAECFEEVLQSELDYEGVNEPLVESEGGAKHFPVHELRDPYIINDNSKKYMFYTIAGETGIAVVELLP